MDCLRQQKLRQRFLLRRCKRVKVSEAVYHGSPVEGLDQIRRHGKIEPQHHGTLAGDWFCVSVNDNMLLHFSEGEGITGMVFNPPKPLQCLQLDWMHFALLAHAGENFQPDWLERHPHEAAFAERLDYMCYSRHDMHLDEHEFRRMLPDWVDGLILPWGLAWPNGNEEAEIALTNKGCATIWAHLDQIVLQGDWHEPKPAWRKIARLAQRQHAA